MPYAAHGTTQLFYETFGNPADPTLLIINGLGSQSTNYADEWCQRFADEGFHVVRFDNRDVGLSTSFAVAPVDDAGAAYRLADMADDAIAVLDALGVERAHVMGLSMGGMITQQLAIDHPDRLRSITSVMSHTGEPEYGQPAPEALSMLMAMNEPPSSRDEHIDRYVVGMRIWGSPEFADETRWREAAGRAYDRSFTPDGTVRHYNAIRASGSRADALRRVKVPALVLHGSADRLVDPSGGRRTAELIPGARFELLEGMGHDYPPQFWDRWVALVTEHARAADAAASA